MRIILDHDTEVVLPAREGKGREAQPGRGNTLKCALKAEVAATRISFQKCCSLRKTLEQIYFFLTDFFS